MTGNILKAKPTSAASHVRHDIKMPVFASVESLREFHVQYGQGMGVGFAFVVRLVKAEVASDPAQKLHAAQNKNDLMICLHNVPAPLEVESFCFPLMRLHRLARLGAHFGVSVGSPGDSLRVWRRRQLALTHRSDSKNCQTDDIHRD